MDDVQQLFHSINEEEYQRNLLSRSEMWDSAFKCYYMSEFHPDVCQSIGRWVLEEYKVYNPYSGITNNQSEGFNRFVYDNRISLTHVSIVLLFCVCSFSSWSLERSSRVEGSAIGLCSTELIPVAGLLLQ